MDLALRNVGSSVQLTQLLYTRSSVVALVHANGDAVIARDRFHHLHGRLWLGGTAADAQAMLHHQPVAVFHQHVAPIAQPCFPSVALL